MTNSQSVLLVAATGLLCAGVLRYFSPEIHAFKRDSYATTARDAWQKFQDVKTPYGEVYPKAYAASDPCAIHEYFETLYKAQSTVKEGDGFGYQLTDARLGFSRAELQKRFTQIGQDYAVLLAKGLQQGSTKTCKGQYLKVSLSDRADTQELIDKILVLADLPVTHK